MSGNGGDNAHNNQFGGGSRGPTGGVKGTSGPGGPGNSAAGGWGWTYNPGKGPVTSTRPDGGVTINITGGWDRVPFSGGGNGGNTNAPPGGSGGDPGKPETPAFNPDGTFDTVIDGFRYRVTLDAAGKTTSVQQTAPRPYSQKETLQVAVAKANGREPAEMFPNLDFSKGEPERQTIARQQAEQAWTGKPENIRSFDEDVDGFKYQVRLNDLGEVQSVTKTADRPYTKKENLKVAVAKANHKAPGEMFPELDFNRGEPERQQRAGQQAVGRFMAVPGAAERVQQLKAQHQAAEEAWQKAEAEKKAAEEAGRQAEEEARKHAEARADAEQKLRSPGVMALRGFPATDAVSLAPLRYSVAGVGSITLDEPMAIQARNTVNRTLSELGRLLTLNAGGSIGLGIGLLFHSETAGEGSSNVPDNIFSTILPADTLSLPDEATLRDAANTGKTVNLPVRGVLRIQEGAIVTQLVSTPSPTPVRVVNATLDPATGYYGFTTPEEAGVPSRTILTSPADAPGAEGPTILTGPVPLPEVVAHTGGPVQMPDRPTVTTYPKPEEVIRDTIIVFPAESGLKPVYAVFNKPYGETNAKGQYSGRDYNTDRAGGPVQNLDWKGATIDRDGVDRVKLHTGRFGESPDNKVMIDRLEKILKGEMQPTDTDKRFYTHEIRELERYRNLGIKDGELPENYDEVWNNTHTATLEDYKINEKTQPLYTPEAEEAYRKAEEGK
ncbi:S-type pyocin domain-containing protein [Klebsiella pneumoniae]|uniref:S-type pyocin domain-containing protein n=1 Tax=Klebsiella pneumoniae TaxID=573 RepID=UPI001D10D13D|nr:S-type pyocin domain-containing protein [Klebsiella pneumoniae]